MSKCGNCGRAADPHEPRHDTLLGYGDDNGKPGCRHYFKYLASDYMGIEKEVKAMRPDLEWVSSFPLPAAHLTTGQKEAE
jgi:hypothetical protein